MQKIAEDIVMAITFGALGFILGIAFDVTREKLAERRLRRAEAEVAAECEKTLSTVRRAQFRAIDGGKS